MPSSFFTVEKQYSDWCWPLIYRWIVKVTINRVSLHAPTDGTIVCAWPCPRPFLQPIIQHSRFWQNAPWYSPLKFPTPVLFSSLTAPYFLLNRCSCSCTKKDFSIRSARRHHRNVEFDSGLRIQIPDPWVVEIRKRLMWNRVLQVLKSRSYTCDSSLDHHHIRYSFGSEDRVCE